MKSNKFLPFCVVIFLNVVSYSQIINKGKLQIEPLTDVYFAEAYTNTASGEHHNDGELYINQSFTNDGSTTSVSGTTFFNSLTNPLINISGATGNINFYNIEVNVTVGTEGVSVVDNFGLIVGHEVNLVSGNLRLVGEAQLVQTHTGVNANTSGSGKLLRDQQGISNTFGYNFWSSPVNNNAGSFSLNGGLFDGTDATINSFSPQQVSFNYGFPYNGVAAVVDGSNNVTTPLTISDRWLYKYSPSTSGYGGWEKIDLNSPLSPGIGFSMKGTGVSNQNYVFKGIPNDGIYTFTLKAGESELLGNPYPSALDSYEFITDNLGVIEDIKIWVDGGSSSHYLSNYLGGYSVQNLSGGVAPSVITSILGTGLASGLIPKQYIAVAQGFFVQALMDGNVIFNNSQRAFKIEDGVESNFYKTSNAKESDKFNVEETISRIRIGYEDPELFHRQLLLGFLPNSTANLDSNIGYDGMMMDSRDDEVFFIIENDLTKKYVIQGVGAYDNTYEFPIGIIITQQGNHSIMLDDVENFTEPVYIKDNLLNTTYNLSESSFSPNLSPGEYLDRFSIVFNSITLNNANIFNDNDLRVYYTNNNIIINNIKNIPLSKVKIFNELGQQVVELNNNELHQQKVTIPFAHQKGLYIVQIESELRKKGFKIIN
jgi:hypothetical protein